MKATDPALAEAPPSTPSFATGISLARLAAGVFILTVLGFTWATGAMVGRPSLMNYFGFFTNSTSLLAALIYIGVGACGAISGRVPTWLMEAKGVIAASLIVVGVGYNSLPGVGTAPGWVSALLHAIFPIAVVLDWALVGDRPLMMWSKLWLVLPYPALWLAMIQYRWATDRWVPYWFMHPSHGPLSLTLRMGGVLLGLVAAAVVIWALSRYRGVFAASSSGAEPSNAESSGMGSAASAESTIGSASAAIAAPSGASGAGEPSSAASASPSGSGSSASSAPSAASSGEGSSRSSIAAR